ncbi:hypothetical protein [Leptospira levettii]|uniref:hypothetical protein n=1 Tax=Leptospira levettii TaxID=2023178 RepID=UPI003EBDDA6A
MRYLIFMGVKMKNLIFVLCILVASGLHSADSNKIINELKSAALIDGDELRLKTYDTILENYQLKQKKPKQERIHTKWEVSIDTNPLDDTKIFLFYLVADEGKSSWDQKILLMIRKSSNGDELFINWGSYLGSEAFVTLRVGKSVASMTQWNLSTDGKATFYSGSTIELIREIATSEKIVAQCTPFNENPITAVFDVRGFRKLAEKYNKELEWFED